MQTAHDSRAYLWTMPLLNKSNRIKSYERGPSGIECSILVSVFGVRASRRERARLAHGGALSLVHSSRSPAAQPLLPLPTIISGKRLPLLINNDVNLDAENSISTLPPLEAHCAVWLLYPASSGEMDSGRARHGQRRACPGAVGVGECCRCEQGPLGRVAAGAREISRTAAALCGAQATWGGAHRG